jgi:hypothetical protein
MGTGTGNAIAFVNTKIHCHRNLLYLERRAGTDPWLNKCLCYWQINTDLKAKMTIYPSRSVVQMLINRSFELSRASRSTDPNSNNFCQGRFITDLAFRIDTHRSGFGHSTQ